MPQYHDLYSDVYGSNFDRALKLQQQILESKRHDAELAETIRQHRANQIIQQARYLQAAQERQSKAQESLLNDTQANYTANTANPPAAASVTPDTSNPEAAQWTARANALRSQYFANHPAEQPGPPVPYMGGQGGVSSYLRSTPNASHGVAAERLAFDKEKYLNKQGQDDPKTKGFKDVISSAGLPVDDLLSADNIWTVNNSGNDPATGQAMTAIDPKTAKPYAKGAAVPAELADTVAYNHPQKGYQEFPVHFPSTPSGKTMGGPALVIKAYHELKGRGKVSPAPGGSGPSRVSSVQEAMGLPSGTIFVDPSGKTRKVP